MRTERIMVAMLSLLAAGCSQTTVQVTKLEQSYDVRIITNGRHALPVSPEGPFPKWSQCSGFLLKGPGTPTNGSIRYLIGLDALSRGQQYDSGFITINLTNHMLELRGNMAGSYSSAVNHSGVYKDWKLETPSIETVVDYERLEMCKGKFVKIVGPLINSSHCQLNGGSIYTTTWLEVGPTYSLIGWVGDGFGGDKYQLNVWEVSTNK